MLIQLIRKNAMLANGLVNSYVRSERGQYDSSQWWDRNFYTQGVSDRQTIHANKHRLSSKYHYASVEKIIVRYLFNRRVQPAPSLSRQKTQDSNIFANIRIVDLGSGSGHWIDLFSELGAQQITGIDISSNSVSYLREKYEGIENIDIFHGSATEVLREIDIRADLVTAIGFMFHIVDDSEWKRCLEEIGELLKTGGLLIIGGHFGLIDGLNVAVDSRGNVIKRLRSKRRWIRELRACGFTKFKLVRNHSYLKINDPLPENHLLFAER